MPPSRVNNQGLFAGLAGAWGLQQRLSFVLSPN